MALKLDYKTEGSTLFLKANYDQTFLQITCRRALKNFVIWLFQSKVEVKKTLHWQNLYWVITGSEYCYEFSLMVLAVHIPSAPQNRMISKIF